MVGRGQASKLRPFPLGFRKSLKVFIYLFIYYIFKIN